MRSPLLKARIRNIAAPCVASQSKLAKKTGRERGRERESERSAAAAASSSSNKKGVPSLDDENWNCWARRRRRRRWAEPARLSGCFSPLIVIPNAAAVAAAESVSQLVGPTTSQVRSGRIPNQSSEGGRSGPQKSFFLSLSRSRYHA